MNICSGFKDGSVYLISATVGSLSKAQRWYLKVES
jgi:hypothetical protein